MSAAAVGTFLAPAPGPWKVDRFGGMTDATGRAIGRLYRHGPLVEGDAVDLATAVLVAAAPLMLEALEAADVALGEVFESFEGFVDGPAFEDARGLVGVALETARVLAGVPKARQHVARLRRQLAPLGRESVVMRYRRGYALVREDVP